MDEQSGKSKEVIDAVVRELDVKESTFLPSGVI